jgi:hypothetical protein
MDNNPIFNDNYLNKDSDIFFQNVSHTHLDTLYINIVKMLFLLTNSISKIISINIENSNIILNFTFNSLTEILNSNNSINTFNEFLNNENLNCELINTKITNKCIDNFEEIKIIVKKILKSFNKDLDIDMKSCSEKEIMLPYTGDYSENMPFFKNLEEVLDNLMTYDKIEYMYFNIFEKLSEFNKFQLFLNSNCQIFEINVQLTFQISQDILKDIQNNNSIIQQYLDINYLESLIPLYLKFNNIDSELQYIIHKMNKFYIDLDSCCYELSEKNNKNAREYIDNNI